MAIPKLFKATSVLEKDEWSSLKKYLLMHTREDSDNFRCFKLLYDAREKLGYDSLDEVLRQKHFPSMSSKSFSNMLSRLFGWFEDWFAFHTFSQQPYDQELMLLKGYNQKGLYKLADQTASKIKAKIKNNPYLSLEKNKALAKLSHLQYYSNNPIKRSRGNTLFEDCLDYYINSTVEQALSLNLEIQNHTLIRDTAFPAQEKILTGLSALSEDTMLSEVFNLALKVIKKNDLNSFLGLKQQLESNKMDKSSDLWLILVSYLSRGAATLLRKNLIDAKLGVEIQQLKFEAIENHKSLKLLPVNFFNGVSSLAILLNYEQTEEFIIKWIEKVHTKYKESVLAYSRAINAFRHDRYDEIPQLVNGLYFDDFVYKLISNVLLIIAYYKIGEEDLLITLVQNFKKQLKRNHETINHEINEGLQNLADVILLLQKAKYDKSVVINLNSYKYLFYKTWVIKEIKR